MNGLVSTALQFRTLVVAAAIVLMVIGIRTADDVPLDVFPEFAPPKVEIQTEAPGLSTEEVESLVTVPIEDSLNGIPYLDHVRSKSVLGLSSIQLFFARGTDLIIARQLVQERLTLSGSRLPNVVKPPVILPPLSSLSRAMKIGLSSETLSQMELTVLSKWTIRPRLMAVPGVANVAIWGDYDKQFQVLVNPDRLRSHGLTLNSVMASVGKSVDPISGGFIDTPNQRLAIRHPAAIRNVEDLKGTVVAIRNGAPLRLGEVCDVRVDSPPPIGDAIINDVPGILLIVEKQPWANTLDVTRGVEAAMEQLTPALPGVDVDTKIFRPATFIERALRNLGHSLVVGCVLVIIVLAIFLFNWRAALISSLAIPLSLVAAVMVLYYRGGTINTMVLAGLIIALGEVVDDAIIDVENILRRLRLEPLGGTSEVGISRRFGRVDRSPQRGSVRHADRRDDAHTCVLSSRAGRFLLSAVGRLLHPCDSRISAGCLDRDTCVVTHPVATNGQSRSPRIAVDCDSKAMVFGNPATLDSASHHRRHLCLCRVDYRWRLRAVSWRGADAEVQGN